MVAEQVEPDTFLPPHRKLKPSIETKLYALLKEYTSPICKIWNIPWNNTSHRNEPVPLNLYLKSHTKSPWKNYQSVKDKIEKLLTAKVIWSSRWSWLAPIIVVPKRDRGKWLVIDYHTCNKVTRKFTWPMPKVEDIFSKLNDTKYFSTLFYKLVTTIYLLINLPDIKWCSTHHLASMNISKYLLDWHKLQHTSRNSWQAS